MVLAKILERSWHDCASYSSKNKTRRLAWILQRVLKEKRWALITVAISNKSDSVNSPIMATRDPLPIIANARLLNGGWARRHLSMLIGKHGG